jgi:hypothetical protein
MANRVEDSSQIDLMRVLSAERDDYAERLATYEFDLMIDALTSGRAAISEDAHTASRVASPYAKIDEDLPRMHVPLSRCTWHRDASKLPIMGVFVADGESETLQGLIGLLHEWHAAPFAKLFIITRPPELVPFFDHFGFGVTCIGMAEVRQIGPLIHKRFGVSQIREAKTGQRIWAP